jgi:hypothetical protein
MSVDSVEMAEIGTLQEKVWLYSGLQRITATRPNPKHPGKQG